MTSLWLHNCYSLVAFVGRNASLLPMQEIQEMQVLFLGQEDHLEKDVATHSSILTWRIPWTEEPVGCSPWGHKEMNVTEGLTHTGASYKWNHAVFVLL